MLLAVGGSFFSSSATGYSKGLALLLLWQRNRKKPMKVAPCNQYQLVDQETDPDILLAPSKNWLIWGCNSFVCFDCTANRRKGSSPVKVGLTADGEVLTPCLCFEEVKDDVHSDESISNHDGNMTSPKSILKKTVKNDSVSDHCNGNMMNDALPEADYNMPSQIGKRKVMWPDTIGRELFEIREYVASEAGSEDEVDHISGDTCSGRCIIM